MFRTKLAAFTCALTLSISAIANDKICPEIDAIKAEGLSLSMQIQDTFTAYQISSFNTESNWGFVIAPIAATTTDEALEHANTILKNITAPGVLEDYYGYAICSYETGVPDIFAIAVQSDFVTPLKLKQLIPHKR